MRTAEKANVLLVRWIEWTVVEADTYYDGPEERAADYLDYREFFIVWDA
jgi:hypothetical protein